MSSVPPGTFPKDRPDPISDENHGIHDSDRRDTENFSAYAPDLPGCVATGAALDDVVREMRSAIAFHIESLREHRVPVPDPRCTATVVNVAAAG